MKQLKLTLLMITCMLVSGYSTWSFSASLGALLSSASQLNFSVSEQKTIKSKLVQYQHDSSVGIEMSSKYQLSRWVQIEVDLQGKYQNNFAEVSFDEKIFITQNYSALANFGKKIFYHKHEFTPFAQLGVNYEQDKNTAYLPYSYREKTFDSTKLQYGFGLRYSNLSWGGLGVSFLYKRNSSFSDLNPQSFEETLPITDNNNSIGISVDLSF